MGSLTVSDFREGRDVNIIYCVKNVQTNGRSVW